MVPASRPPAATQTSSQISWEKLPLVRRCYLLSCVKIRLIWISDVPLLASCRCSQISISANAIDDAGLCYHVCHGTAALVGQPCNAQWAVSFFLWDKKYLGSKNIKLLVTNYSSSKSTICNNVNNNTVGADKNGTPGFVHFSAQAASNSNISEAIM